MEENLPLIFLILALLVLCSAFFSGAETAYTCLNQVRVKNRANAGDKRAAQVLKLVGDYDRLISSILIGNNIVNILASSLATVAFVRLIGSNGVSVSTAVMTAAVLLFGEIAPKTLARVRSEQLAFAFYPVMNALVHLFLPLNFLMGCWQRLVSRLVSEEKEHTVTEEELITMVQEAESGGEIDSHESELIRSAIEFTDLTAEDILTPRVDLTAVELSDPDELVARRFAESGYSRLPVYEESIDNVVGILHEKDFFLKRGSTPIRDMMTSPVFVLPTAPLSAVLRLLQRRKTQIAVVMDEYGGVEGIVSMEDILEELVGEIWDEHDEIIEDIRPIGENAWRVRGSASLDDLAETVGLKKEYSSVTVNGWVQEELGYLPAAGEVFRRGDLRVTVEKIDRHRVVQILAEKKKEKSL